MNESWKKKAGMLALLTALTPGLFANPQNPSVVAGTVGFDQPNPSTLQITASDCSIINWDDFSISSGEMTKFIQPAFDSRVLNRVTGGNVSSIMGTLEGNGMIFLINPNGVLVGADGAINTGGFIASTFDVLDSEFVLKGDLHFSGASTATITNLGSIDGWESDVFLIGYSVNNQGNLNTPSGVSGIAAGQQVVLLASGDQRLMIQPVISPPAPSGDGISNTGLIEAIQAELRADGNLYAMAINHTGEIDATGVDQVNGRIFLVAEGGTVQIDGSLYAVNDNDTGGDIQVLGSVLNLTDNADIDVSADYGGGNIWIGGNIPDAEPVLYSSIQTTISEDANLDASCNGFGNGGIITTWSGGTNTNASDMASTGGEIGGDGGTIYVGGVQNLEFTGSGDTSAAFGNYGTLAMGTQNIVVKDLGSGEPVTNIVDISFLESNLQYNNCIVAGFTPGSEEATLHFQDSLLWDDPTTLLFHSDTYMFLRGSVENPSGFAGANFQAHSSVDMTVDGTLGHVNLTMPGRNIELYADNNISLLGGDVDNGDITISASQVFLGGQNDVTLHGGTAENTYVDIFADSYCQFNVGGVLRMEGGTGNNSQIFIPSHVSIFVDDNN